MLVCINADFLGSKTDLETFFKHKRMNAIIKRTGPAETKVKMEGPLSRIYKVYAKLEKKYMNNDPGVELIIEEQRVAVPEDRINKVIVEKPDDDTISPNSSAMETREFSLDHDENISITTSDRASILGHIQSLNFYENTGRLICYAGQTRQMFNRVETGEIKLVKLKYEDKCYGLEVGSITEWEDFISQVRKRIKLATDNIAGIYMMDGHMTEISDIAGLMANQLYVVKTDKVEVKPIWSPEMEGFFGMLKTERGLKDNAIATIDKVFREQEMEFPQLMATGKHAITDETLEK